MIITKVKIVLNLFVTAITEENVYLIKNVFVMMDSMENIVKKVYAQIIVILTEVAIKENVFVKADGVEKLVTLDYAQRIAMEMENALMEDVNVY